MIVLRLVDVQRLARGVWVATHSTGDIDPSTRAEFDFGTTRFRNIRFRNNSISQHYDFATTISQQYDFATSEFATSDFVTSTFATHIVLLFLAPDTAGPKGGPMDSTGKVLSFPHRLVAPWAVG